MKNTRRGFTLVEVVVALGILSIGGLATLQLIGVMITSNQSVSASTDATAIANRLVSEISDARFVNVGDEDPGLVVGTYSAPAAGSTIQSVGTFVRNAIMPGTAGTPLFTVTYQVVECTVCQNPDPAAPGLGVGGREIIVTVTNALGNAGPLLRPVQMVIRKEYTSASAPAGQVRN